MFNKTKGETGAAYKRRASSFFFYKYTRGRGIDIGCGDCALSDKVVKYDLYADDHNIYCGNAIFMQEFEEGEFDFVYSAHCLEDLDDIETALRNWYRILKSGGYLILLLPHRDYCERKRYLPSEVNKSHKHFFLPFISEPPDTFSVYDLLRSVLPTSKIIYVNECCELSGIGIEKEKNELRRKFAARVERSIEVVVQKEIYTPIFELEVIDDREQGKVHRVG